MMKISRIMIGKRKGVDEYNCNGICPWGYQWCQAIEIKTLIQEFELFCTNDDKTISDMQKKFVYLITRLHALGKPVLNEANNFTT
jgi:hypothetical protein